MAKPTQSDAEAAVRVLIEWAGDDPSREGLIDTPSRVARSYRELFAGYVDDPREYLKRTFEEVGGYDELVVLRNIRVVSFCEHHMLPVIGRAHVGYCRRTAWWASPNWRGWCTDSPAGCKSRKNLPPRSPKPFRRFSRRMRRRGDRGRAQLHDVARREHARVDINHQPSARRDP